ncbi:MAG: nicotinate-nucleotide--dimethylbenzimidazole phosphoribosyltransferase [Lachnospiraceae bacterium]
MYEEIIKGIQPLDANAMVNCKARFTQLAKPIYGLGKFEEVFMQIAGITKSSDICLAKKALVVMCADHGVIDEGISQMNSHTTALMADQYNTGKAAACIMAKQAHVDVIPVDIGLKEEANIHSVKVMSGTDNIAKGPAMTIEVARETIELGIRIAIECKEKGYQILIAGELGAGNTTSSTALATVLLEEDVEHMTGTGMGLSFEGLKKKRDVIAKALQMNAPDKKEILETLAKLGGLEIAGLVGVYLGAASCNIPIVLDGYISAVAALVASRLCPLIRSYIIPSHLSKEPGMELVLQRLVVTPFLTCDMNMGEGTGALALMPVFDMVQALYEEMNTFEELGMEPYKVFGCHS